MMPTSKTVFLPIQELANYSDKSKYFCSAIVFSPETENNHFHGCPPYIRLDDVAGTEESIYFKVPVIIAYYGYAHAGYTMAGADRKVQEGEKNLANKIKTLLDINPLSLLHQ